MPYRLSDNKLCVEVQRGDEWETLDCHESEEEAQAHLAALNINVDEAHSGERSKLSNSAEFAAIHLIKAVNIDGEWALDVLGAPYGGPNRGKDAHGEYFSPNTNFYENNNAPLPLVAYYHGYTPDGRPQGEPEIIGQTTKRWRDNQGLWFRVILDQASSLAKRVWSAAQKGTARASSGVAGLMGRTKPDGEITHWLIGELSIWDVEGNRQPANQYAVARPAVKALFEPYLSESQADPEGEEHGQADASQDTTEVSEEHSTQEVESMADQPEDTTQNLPVDLDAMIESRVKAAMDAAEAERQAKEAAEQAEQERIEAAVEAAVAEQRAKWEAEHAAQRRLPYSEGAPNVAKMHNLWKYDNLDAGDLAFLSGVMRNTNRGASDNLLKALAVRVTESDEPHFNRTRSVMQGVGMPVKANELNQSTLSTYGDEWALDAADMALWERIWSNAGIINRLPTVEVPQGYESITIPLQSTPPTFYKVAQASAQDTNTLGKVTYTVTSSKMATGSQSLTVGKLGARTIYTGELEEDSMIPWVSELRNSMSMEAVEILESLVIDGDTATGATTNINDIAGTPAGTEYYLVLDGFRKLALVTNTANSRSAGALTAEDFLETLKLMGLQGKNAQDMNGTSFIVDAATHWTAMPLPEVKTRDVFGNPTIENGQLTRIYGREVINSFNMHRFNADTTYGLKANSAGKIDVDTASNNIYGAILAVRWDQWRFGWKRRITFEMERIPQADATEIVCLMRCGMVYRDTEASAISYGVTV